MIKKYFLATIAGLLMSRSFNEPAWIFAFASMILLIYLLDRVNRKQRFNIVAIFSMSYFLAHLVWVQVIGYDAWILLSLVSAFPWLIAAINPVNYRNYFSITLFASTVVVIEVLRSHIPYGGFPWGLIAFSQIDGPLINFARLGGQALVTFLVVFLSAVFLRMFSKHFVYSILIIAITFIIGAQEPKYLSNSTFKVLAIQGNVPRLGLDLSAQRLQVFNNHVNVTSEFLSDNPSTSADLIIWPESATDIDPLQNREVADKIDELAKIAKSPILVGATINGTNPDGPRGSGILWNEDGPNNFYIKNHLVPFGEYIPHRDFLGTFIDRISLVPRDFIAGTEIGLFQIGKVKFGDVICYEVSFGETVRHLVRDGAQFLVIQTNNATYGNTSQPEQQFQISRFRAIEHGRSVIIASTSGISGAISPNGEVIAKTEQFVSAVVAEELPLVESKTINDRFPRWTAILSLIFLGLFQVNSSIRKRIA
ncbi:MAG: putative polyprenol-phosphate-mannose synthase [Actinomycetota bacterium]